MLSFSNLQIGYQSIINALPLQFDFRQGQLVVLLGRNGCGKTTLLRTIDKTIKPLQGHITIDKLDNQQISPKQFAQKISIVTTQRLDTPYLKVYDLVAMGRYPYLGFWGKLQAKDQQIIKQIFQDLGIQNLASKYVDTCSDGEQQLVLLARALAQDTPIILLDEATAHLDFVNRVRIFQTLKKLAIEQNKLIFLATHELEIALKFAHQVILFQTTSIEINDPSYFIKNKKIEKVFEVEGLDYQLNL